MSRWQGAPVQVARSSCGSDDLAGAQTGRHTYWGVGFQLATQRNNSVLSHNPSTLHPAERTRTTKTDLTKPYSSRRSM